ncbi:DUF3850 domain-containing protein [Gluconobacter oxydans]|uniref:DUF3850 domain-containing protein n=1 Tax=Gluconobacter oxydans TaxID=442 RepID=UPI0007824072|nr:DUF3850 domain-containing protein [Gluconobacter oxydans]KXV12592.1 hypothetical protein AD932_06695 [Gluconobacter oxydans]
MRRIHELKTKPLYYDAVVLRQKTAEVRLDDRGYQVGDLVELYPWTKGLGRIGTNSVVREITFILSAAEGPWLTEGHVMLCFGTPS